MMQHLKSKTVGENSKRYKEDNQNTIVLNQNQNMLKK